MLPWQHFFLFLGLMNIFMGSLLSIPLHRLELISFSATPGNNVAILILFCVSWTYKYFYGFFVFHTPAQIWQQFVFFGLKNLCWGSLHSKPLQTWDLISFSATPSNKCCHGSNFFSVSWTYRFVGSLHSKPQHE